MPFSALAEGSFVGRDRSLADLAQLAARPDRFRSLLIAGPHGVGKTELLRQLYTLLFWKQDAVMPFSYTVPSAFADLADLAHDYLVHFLCQWFGFDRKDQALVTSDGMGLDELTSLAAARGAEWAIDLIGRFRSAASRPADQVRTALSAPQRAARAQGRPVLVMIDDLPLLFRQQRDGSSGPRLAADVAGLLEFRQTPHLLAGTADELDALPLPVLPRFEVAPLVPGDADLLVRTVLKERGIVSDPAPQELLRRLGGIPRYLRSLAEAVEADQQASKYAFLTAYRREVDRGMIARSWQARLRSAVADPAERRHVLQMLHALGRGDDRQAAGRTARSLQTAFPGVSSGSLAALCREGALSCGFSAIRPSDDQVLTDVITLLYEREVLGRAPEEVALPPLADEAPGPAASTAFTVSLLLPHERNAELIAAQCLEQIGRNRDIPDDVVGQLQIALIEACVNAIEHGTGRDPVPVSITVNRGAIVVAVSSPVQDLTLDATGEPVSASPSGAFLRRGWGVTLMKRFCSSVRFERTTRGTTVVLTKEWAPAPSSFLHGEQRT